MKLKGKKIAVLLESDFYEHEIWYYHYRFPEEGAEVHFLTRLWGQPSIMFKGHEYHTPFECNQSFENMDDATLWSCSRRRRTRRPHPPAARGRTIRAGGTSPSSWTTSTPSSPSWAPTRASHSARLT